jgi:hypothetical protein
LPRIVIGLTGLRHVQACCRLLNGIQDGTTSSAFN